MDTPKVSHDALKRLSMELGATLELPGGKVFNSAGEKGFHSVAKPKPAPVDNTQKLLEQLILLAGKPATAVPAPQVTVSVPEKKPVSWKFDFERNPDGTIKSITANPRQ